MRELPDKCIDLVLTDPPYGIAKTWVGGFSDKHGWGKAGAEASVRNEWDDKIPGIEYFNEIFRVSKNQIIWGGNYFPLPVSRGWLVWNKPERNFTLAEAELAWTSRDMVIRVLDFHRSDTGRQHPTQKPLDLMRWCLNFFPDCKTVLDPFAGSGTTLRAAMDLQKDFIGIEISPDYCQIAENRLKQQVLNF